MFIFSCLWFVTCITIKLLTEDTKGYHLSLVHSLLQSSSAIVLLPTLKPNVPILGFEYLLIMLIVYLLFDLIANETKKDMKLHHIIVIIGATYSFCYGIMHSVGVLLLLNEISTVFLNVSSIQTNPTKLIKIGFVISFFIFRILLIPFIICYCIIPSIQIKTDYIILIMLCLHMVLNFNWFIKIIKKVKKNQGKKNAFL